MVRWLFALVLFALPAAAEQRIQEVTSPGGIRAWLIEDRSIPFMALEIRFRGGTNLDAPGKRGATNLMAALIEEGAGDLDAQGFAAARDGLAADLGFEAGGDALSVSARFLTENRDQALDLLHLALTEPRFDPDAVERVRGQVLAIIESDAKDPGSIAGQALDRLAWGDHPYGSDPNGTLDSVAALTRDDIVAAFRAAVARDRIYVAAAGDISAADLGPLLDRLFDGLPETGAPQPGPGTWQASGGVTVEPFPGPQSLVLFGQPGLGRMDPDFFPAFVLNEILGGGRFSARLMTELREKRGLTYGIGTSLVPMDLGASWLGQFSSDNARVAEAVEVLRAEWARAAAGDISQAELDATKTYMTGSYPLRWDGNGPIANILVGLQMQGLPIDYAINRNAYVEAVTLADVQRVAATLMQPDGLRFVVVGQPEGLAP
jgi:zinc protease